MGAVEYIRLVRQRFAPEGQPDVTNSPNSSVPDEPMEDAPAGPAEGQTLSDMMEFLKAEHAQCLERNELWDANSVQNLILSFLNEVRANSARSMINRCREKIAEVFGKVNDHAAEQNRWESADRYQAVENMHRDG